MGRGSGAHWLCLLSLGRNLPFHGDTSWRRVPALREVKWDLSQIYNYVRWSSKNSTVVRQYHVVGLDLNFDFSLRKKINLQTCSYQPEANLWLKHYQYFRKWKIIILRSFCSVRGEALIYGHPAGCRFISTAHIMVKPHHQHHLRQPSLSSSKWLSSRDLIISIISIIVSIVLGPLIVNICFPLSR